MALEEFLNAFEQLDFDRFAGSFIQNNEVSVIFPGAEMRSIYRGWASVRRAWQKVFEIEKANSEDGKIKLVVTDLSFQNYGNSAIASFLVNSSPPEIVHRRTIVFIKEKGRWLIVHLHGSNYDQQSTP